MQKAKKKRRNRILTVCLTAVVIIVIAVLILYHNRAFPEARELAGEMEQAGNDYYLYGDSDVGFMIFAGSKTDEKAYAYLASLLHEEGYTVVIPKQPLYLSIFGAARGKEVMEENPEVKHWILIGHSMGGWPVSQIAASDPDNLSGLVFLATFASADLSDLDVPALRISAENDGIMNNDKMDTYEENLPADSVSLVMEGANHEGFGAYNGTFHNDGEATMTWQEQNEQTVQLILDFFAERTDLLQGEE